MYQYRISNEKYKNKYLNIIFFLKRYNVRTVTDVAILQSPRTVKYFYTKPKQDAVKNKLIYGEYVIPAAIFERFNRRAQYIYIYKKNNENNT